MAVCSLAAQAYDTLYLLGSGVGLGWNPAYPTEIQKDADGNFTFSVKALEKFKISYTHVGDPSLPPSATDDWSQYLYGAYTVEGTPAIGTPVSLVKGDADIVMGSIGDYNITVTGDFSTITFTEMAKDDLTGKDKIYIVGSGDGMTWNPKEATVVEKKDGMYTFTLTNVSDFRISYNDASGAEDDGWNTFNEGSIGAVPYFGQYVETNSGTNNISVMGGNFTVEMTDDMLAMCVTCNEFTYDNIYLVGGETGWGFEDNYKMTHMEGTKFYINLNNFPANSGFKLANGGWGTPNYGITEAVEAGKGYNLVETNDEIRFKDAFTGSIVLEILGPQNAYAVFSAEQVGMIESVAASEGAKEYYNLQGIRIADPQNGLFIEKSATGSKLIRK